MTPRRALLPMQARGGRWNDHHTTLSGMLWVLRTGALGGGRVERNRPDEPEDHALGRSRGGWGSKLHLVSDGAGVPLAACVTAGQAHESTPFECLMQEVRPPRRERWPGKAAGDKGYSYPRVRRWLARRGIDAVIPQRSDEVERESRRNPLRQAGGQLQGVRAAGVHPAVPQASRSVRQNLVDVSSRFRRRER
jgi:transposase